MLHVLTVALMLPRVLHGVLCPSVVCDVCIVAKQYCVLAQKLLDSPVYEESIATKMSGLGLCLEVV